jgi:hypothetical protein
MRTPVIATASVEPAGPSAPVTALATSSARSAARWRVSWSPSSRTQRGKHLRQVAHARSENVDDVVAARTGEVLVADAPAPGVGWP